MKTDRNDARHLAQLVAANLVTPVRVPSIAEEAARDLVRARDDARGDAMRARHRLSKLLLRQGITWDKTTWTRQHLGWLAGLSFAQPGVQVVFDDPCLMKHITESVVEEATLGWFGSLGYAVAYGPELAPGEPRAERDSFEQGVSGV